jgi:hypothetical protein
MSTLKEVIVREVYKVKETTEQPRKGGGGIFGWGSLRKRCWC